MQADHAGIPTEWSESTQNYCDNLWAASKIGYAHSTSGKHLGEAASHLLRRANLALASSVVLKRKGLKEEDVGVDRHT